jgi:hypothetical protein
MLKNLTLTLASEVATVDQRPTPPLVSRHGNRCSPTAHQWLAEATLRSHLLSARIVSEIYPLRRFHEYRDQMVQL